ncbi:MAG: outer membrane protein beta-barrel domain [Rickettsiaceae bacterium]|jgi:opacity protein-like surface antigen|nr:outer membrane protein beta-barrel domain [Rickettsiaceae bacterium]
MKKFLPIFCSVIALSSQSQAATGVYIGADGLRTHAIHDAKNSSILLGPQDGSRREANNGGYGANAGIRFDPLFFYVAGEVFYDHLNSSSKGFDQNIIGTGPNINMDERFGAKANVGITILPWLTPYVSYGVAKVKYETDVSKYETAPIYGAGILFDLPTTNLSVKASYDIQKFDIPYQNAKSDTKLGVARVGVTYTFGE